MASIPLCPFPAGRSRRQSHDSLTGLFYPMDGPENRRVLQENVSVL